MNTNKKGSSNANLRKANKAKKDEFYTQLVDIEKELKYYKSQLKGKVIYCNCDDPFESNFFKYFALNFNFLGLKKLITTSYTKSPIAGDQLSLFEIKGLEPDGKQPFKIEITEVPDEDNSGSIDITDIEILLKSDKNTATPLKGNGDFRNKECIELLKKSDIVVTNPPFSLFREYVAQLVEYKKKFLIIGNMNAVSYKEIFKLIKDNKIWLGYSPRGMDFFVPDGDLKNVNACWFTNLSVLKRNEILPLYKKYNKEEYPKYDNYDAIEVAKTSGIPLDYNEVMGVPITFLDKYNPKQFEIIGITDRQNSSGLRTKKYTIEDSINFNDLNARSVLKIGNTFKTVYARLLIRKK